MVSEDQDQEDRNQDQLTLALPTVPIGQCGIDIFLSDRFVYH